jgi:hypothetical protein
MVGYKRERAYVFEKYGVRIETCHVASVKVALKLTKRPAANRIDSTRTVKPCPPHLWDKVEEAVRHVHADEIARLTVVK